MTGRRAIALTAALGLVASISYGVGSDAASAADGWSGWVSSPVDTSVRLAPVTPTTAAPTATTTVDPGVTFQTWRCVGELLTLRWG